MGGRCDAERADFRDDLRGQTERDRMALSHDLETIDILLLRHVLLRRNRTQQPDDEHSADGKPNPAVDNDPRQPLVPGERWRVHFYRRADTNLSDVSGLQDSIGLRTGALRNDIHGHVLPSLQALGRLPLRLCSGSGFHSRDWVLGGRVLQPW